jgi:hypothetical protein
MSSGRNYEEIGARIGRLVTDKQLAYGDSFGRSGEVMRVLYPNGISREQMDDALTVVRVVDKLFRVSNIKDAFGESPWGDIVGYGILSVERDERLRRELQNNKARDVQALFDAQLAGGLARDSVRELDEEQTRKGRFGQ